MARTRKRKARRMHGFDGARKGRRRGRRLHGVAGGKVTHIVGDAAGVLAGALAAALIAPRLPLPEKIRWAAPLALGLVLASGKVVKAKIAQSAGIGMIAAGGLSAIRSFQPSLPMLGAASDAEEALNIPAVSGEELLGIPAVAGIDDEVEGADDEVEGADDEVEGVPALLGSPFVTSAAM